MPDSSDEGDISREHLLNDGVDNQIENQTAEILSGLIDRARTLQNELEAFRTRLKDLRLERNVELGHFRGTIQSELGMLERLQKQPKTEITGHVARSSNLPYLEHLWSTVKRREGLVSLQKRVHTASGMKMLSQGFRWMTLVDADVKAKTKKDSAVVIDAITEHGQTWMKISLVTNNRILFDLAKLGWESGGSDYGSEDEEFLPPRLAKDDEERDVPLVKTAKELARAVRRFRVRSRTPTIYLVLPRIVVGEYAEVDAVLQACRDAGATLICGPDPIPLSPLDDSLALMAPDPLSTFTDTINIDCTILLALVSEFSHAKVSKEAWFHPSLKRQVEIEGNENLLPSLLYPAMASRRLVATEEAIRRMREIVNTIGTASEKARTRIMLGDDKTRTREQLIADMAELSAYPVLSEWQLPIEVIHCSIEDIESQAPDVGKQVCGDMTAINKTVFLYGWKENITTLTSNRTIVKQIEHELEKCIDLDESMWPKIWLCPTARSLVGKEKRGGNSSTANGEGEVKVKTKREPKKDVLHLPDPLRREEQRRNGLDVLSMREGHDVEDLRPNGYDYEDVIAAKNASQR